MSICEPAPATKCRILVELIEEFFGKVVNHALRFVKIGSVTPDFT
jgi:hypothetical protein